AIGQGGVYDATRRVVTWSGLLDVEPGGSRLVLTLTTQVGTPLPATVCSQVVVDRSSTDDPRTPAPQDRTCVPASAPYLEATLAVTDAGGDGLFAPGEAIRYTVTVRNLGNADLTPVRVTAALPPQAAPYRPVTIPAGAVDRSDLASGQVAVEAIDLPLAAA